MILAQKGKLSVVQSLTAGATDSTNVIQYTVDGSGVDYAAMTDLWLVIDTNVVASGSGTLTFDLVMAQEAALNNTVSVVRTYIASIADLRVATAGRHITAINIGKTLKEMLETDASGYEFIGLIYTLSSSAAITVNASLSPTEPHTIHHKMVIRTNVSVPTIASVGSGE